MVGSGQTPDQARLSTDSTYSTLTFNSTFYTLYLARAPVILEKIQFHHSHVVPWCLFKHVQTRFILVGFDCYRGEIAKQKETLWWQGLKMTKIVGDWIARWIDTLPMEIYDDIYYSLVFTMLTMLSYSQCKVQSLLPLVMMESYFSGSLSFHFSSK